MKITKMNNPKKITDFSGEPVPIYREAWGGIVSFFLRYKR